MTTLQFKLICEDRKRGLGWYTSCPVPCDPPFLYYLLSRKSGSTAKLTDLVPFHKAWRKHSGCFLFSHGKIEIETPDELYRIARYFKVDPRRKNLRVIAWLFSDSLHNMEPNAVRVVVGRNDQATIIRGAEASLSFGDVGLTLSEGTLLDPDYEKGRIVFLSRSLRGISLQRKQTDRVMLRRLSLNLNPEDGAFGIFSAEETWNATAFLRLFRDNPRQRGIAWGGEIRFFPDDDTQLVYPIYTPPADRKVAFTLTINMHPLYPSDPRYTSFVFMPDKIPPTVACKFALDIRGKPVRLTPVDQVGFYFGRRPQFESEPSQHGYIYLAPLGRYRVDAGKATTVNLMCGVSGLEYLQLADGDILEFVGNQPAYARKNPSQSKEISNHDASLLSSRYTTSWVRLSSSRPDQTAAAVKSAYFAQPNRMTNYAEGALDTHYSAAVAAFIQELPIAEKDPSARAFPLALYGGIFPVPGTRMKNWPNKGTDGSAFQQFEERILTTTRFHHIKDEETPPPAFQNLKGDGLTGRAVTTQGFLLDLNDGQPSKDFKIAEAAAPAPSAGTWNQLILAQNNGQSFSFNKDAQTGVVDADLAHALMNNQVFLVLNNWSRFTEMNSDLSMGGFRFMLRPPPEVPDPARTILIFKYNHALNLEELMEIPGVWADPQKMLADRDITLAQGVFREAKDQADKTEGRPHDPFLHFRTVVAADPAWTGIVALNVPTTGEVPELEMLFAGIDGELRAHHFGVEINQIKKEDATSEPEIDRSSLFGVIYKPPPDDDSLNPADGGEEKRPFEFSVRELIVGIKNTAVTRFNATVGMVINELFGRDVILVDPGSSASKDTVAVSNMMTIEGQYQRQGGVGSVIFALQERKPPYFTFKDPTGALEKPIRVLDKFILRGASLVPVAAEADATKDVTNSRKTIRSRFSLDGELFFHENPFPGITGIDLFSYGVNSSGRVEKGLGVHDLAFDINFNLDASGKKEGPTIIVPTFDNITVKADKEAIRGKSLLKGLPLKLSGFLQNEAGISSSQIGASPMHMQQIQDYVTSTPQYALRFEMPLGSLGGLSGVHAGIEAFLVLAWGPSMASPDNDGAAIYVQMPQLSGGYKGFDLQGFLKTTFGDANMMAVEKKDQSTVYAMLFNHVALSIFGISFPPGIIADFILFTNTSDGAGNDTNIAWNLAVTQTAGSGESTCDET